MTEDEILLTHILKCSRTDLLFQKPVLNSDQAKQFQEYKSRRQKGEPLQYIIGEWDFYGLTFKVNPSVLIPRPETEMLVEKAIVAFSLPLEGRVREGGINILDIGTGSGNIPITLAKHIPNARITTIDISSQAIAVAQENAKTHKVQDRIQFLNISIEKLESSLKFDLIISNPPYIPTAQLSQLQKDVQHEPMLALDGGTDGLQFYRTIIQKAPALLRSRGALMFECGDGQAQTIGELFENTQKFDSIEIIKDLNGIPRIVKGLCSV